MGHHNTIPRRRKSQPVLVGEAQERPRYVISFEPCFFGKVITIRAVHPSDKKSKDSRSHDPINGAHRPTLLMRPMRRPMISVDVGGADWLMGR